MECANAVAQFFALLHCSATPILHFVTMFGFLIFAISFVTLLTLVVRLCQLRVRQELAETKSLGLTVGFVALLLAAWWLGVRRRFPGPPVAPIATDTGRARQ